MRRGYLDFTPEFAQTIGLGWMPRAWRLVGSRSSPKSNIVRLVFENDHLPDGPEAHLTVNVHETLHERRIVVLIDGKEAPPPARYYLSADDSGHRYAIPVERRGDWDEWCGDPDAVDHADRRPAEPPAWAIRIDGKFTFAEPSV